MKNCYFILGSGEEGIRVQYRRKKEFVPAESAKILVDSHKQIVYLQDTRTGKRYYPAEDSREIPIL